MSRFSGPQGSGAMARMREQRRAEADERNAAGQERLRQERIARDAEQHKLDRKMRRLGASLDGEGHIIGGTKQERKAKRKDPKQAAPNPASMPQHTDPAQVRIEDAR